MPTTTPMITKPTEPSPDQRPGAFRWIPCQAGNCPQSARTRGYCPRHYQQLRRHGRLTPEREYRRCGPRCRAERCDRPQIAKGYCLRHYQQLRRHGLLRPEHLPHPPHRLSG